MVWCRVHGIELDCCDRLCEDCINQDKCIDGELYCPDYEEY